MRRLIEIFVAIIIFIFAFLILRSLLSGIFEPPLPDSGSSASQSVGQ